MCLPTVYVRAWQNNITVIKVNEQVNEHLPQTLEQQKQQYNKSTCEIGRKSEKRRNSHEYIQCSQQRLGTLQYTEKTADTNCPLNLETLIEMQQQWNLFII